MQKDFTKYTAFAILIMLIGGGCSSSESEESEPVLARVGGEIITIDEFRLNYEFGHGHLRRGTDPKRDYLNYMIAEKLIALEAKKQDLDTLPAIQHAMHTLREELLIERVFEERVLSGVEVTDEEIRAEINRDAVSFKFRLLPAGSRQEAMQLYEAIQQSSFGAVMEEELDSRPELRLVEGELTSPYLKAEEIDPNLLALLKDLELNKPSLPQPYQDAWFIFEVMDIRRERLADADYEAKTPSYQKILYNRKALEAGTAFVAETMQPLNVATKRPAFEVLNEALWAWYKEDTPVRNLLDYIDRAESPEPYMTLLAEHYEKPLVTFAAETWTLYEFLEHFTPGRYVLRTEDAAIFKAHLADIVALVVRDDHLMKIAEQDNLEEDEAFQRSMKNWKQKWLFQEYRNVNTTGASADASRARMKQVADSLANEYKVEVNWQILDTLSTSVSVKNPTQTVHLFKSNANKMPFPIADPNWQAVE